MFHLLVPLVDVNSTEGIINYNLQSATWYMLCELMVGNTEYNVHQLQSGADKTIQQWVTILKI
jgi:hypothetical protein